MKGRNHRIVGGKVANAHEYPWLAGLYRQGKIYCGASIISRNYLLTAAHCLEGFASADIRVSNQFILFISSFSFIELLI